MRLWKEIILAIALTIASAVMIIATARGHSYKAGEIEIVHPWIRAVAAGVTVAAGYLVIRNGGAATDRLLELRLEGFERVELHQTTQAEGVMSMRKVDDGVEVPAQSEVVLAPGGTHAMLTGLAAPLAAGTRIRGTLVFEKAGEVAVEFAVEAKDPAAAAAH